MKKKKKSRFGSNVTADVERRRKQASNYGYLKLPKGLNMFKESEGRVKLDIIPYIVTDTHHPDYNSEIPDVAEVGSGWYKRPIYVHRSIGVENTSIVCPKTIGKKCPICEHRDQQFKDGVDRDEVIGKAQLRYLYLVVPLKSKKYDQEIHLWDISNGNFQSELDEELEENPDNGIFPDPDEGLTLNVRFSEESFSGNKYFKAGRIDFEERKDGYDESIMEEFNLDEIFNVLTYKEVDHMFMELGDEEEEGEEKTDTPDELEENELPFDRKRKRKNVDGKKKGKLNRKRK